MRRLFTASLALAALATLLSGAPALAHHSQAAYDQSKEVLIEGTVARLDWKNPHIYLIVETGGTDGASQQVQVEGLAITQANVDGLDPEALPIGAHVVVRANPNRRGAGKTVRGLDVTTADGAVHPFYAANTRRPALTPAEGLAGKWAPSLPATYAAFGAVRAWPYTDAGRAALTAPHGAGCEIGPTPFLAIINELRTIEVGEDEIVFQHVNEGMKVPPRVVHLDVAEHPADVEPSLFGHAIGRWEGETLVIDTVAFAPHSDGVFSGVPSSPAKHTVERLTLTEDRLHIRYELTMEDPESLAEPATLSMLWDHRPDLELARDGCDEGVAHRFLEE